MRQALIVKTTGELHPVLVTEEDDSLVAIQAAVGGYIELVPSMVPRWRHLSIFCNEEGKIIGLPLNSKATDITGRRGFDPIAGDIIIFGPPDYEGNTTELSDEDMRALMEQFGGEGIVI